MAERRRRKRNKIIGQWQNRSLPFGGGKYIYSVNADKYNESVAVSALDRLEKRGYIEEIVRRSNNAGIFLEVL